MGREFELKYRADLAQLEEIAACYDGFTVLRMETTYYDVPSGILRELHWTLRRRMENDRAVCTVKSNLPDGSRGEWETECDNILTAVPILVGMGAPHALLAYTADGVIPTCGARFTRRALKLPAGSGTIELALDQGCLLGGTKELPFCEVEVELKEGTDDDATQFAQALAAKYRLTRETKSKLARALELAKG